MYMYIHIYMACMAGAGRQAEDAQFPQAKRRDLNGCGQQYQGGGSRRGCDSPSHVQVIPKFLNPNVVEQRIKPLKPHYIEYIHTYAHI